MSEYFIELLIALLILLFFSWLKFEFGKGELLMTVREKESFYIYEAN